MNDSIHKKLTEHIRKTVGRHAVSYEPGSWEEFQRLRNRRRHRPPAGWFRYAITAGLLLGLLGGALWLYVKPSDSLEQAVKHPQPTVSDPNKQTIRPKTDAKQRLFPEGKEPVASDNSTGRPSWQKTSESTPNRVGWNNALPDSRQSLTVRTAAKNRPVPNGYSVKNSDESARPSWAGQPGLFANGRLPNPSAATGAPARPSGLFAWIEPRPQPVYRWSLRPLGLPLRLPSAEGPRAVLDPPKTGQAPTWGISLAPQSVYATGSPGKRAVGSGFFSEIPLNRRFSVSTGLSMARQAVGTTESGPVSAATIPHRVATSIRLTTVDLPLNLRFRPGRSSATGFYLEAGLSSLAFLNERYTETYEQMKEVTVVVMGTNGQEQTVTQYVTERQLMTHSEPAFQRIYWGRLVNFSIGVERRLGNQLRLAAEPYLKYPLGPLTRENLMLGSGGVSLRLGFQAARSRKP